ncbi:4Fe-4S dicluster domain-containing protein [Tichowtungia aerotolerans]|uniref:4Fe-4S dicluster domain-containing protein n=1 Tax=Tichowtungia aerotolerans TaxID=2697043 RepID=A0A6P1M800_9BACT|nr:4Fe-4S dicluster domain-containing protein [Tichowtungia aerotolerans]QHI70001.1 4Fe-4S dicluster domain-containing protein [Tichowtungia aerotolerans]
MNTPPSYSCNIRQIQTDFFAMRLRAVGGDLTADQLNTVADIARRYGSGSVHITTRQGIEIPHVHKKDLAEAQKELETAGIKMGSDGNRVRIVIACPGKNTCRYGSIDTPEIAEEIDRRYFRLDVPYKVKFGVTGCPNNCGKARESDIGIMGMRTPKWDSEKCIRCNACIKLCPVQAITGKDDRYERDESTCIHCSVCSVLCPAKAWGPESTGYTLLIGGTLGKKPRLGIPLKTNIQTSEELFELIEQTLLFYKANGKPKERLGHVINRMGEDAVIQAILSESYSA